METPRTLWIPNREQTLADEYPAATPEELRAAWADYLRTDNEKLDTYDTFLGVTKPPETTPSIVVSVDLCEVLRMTHASLRTVEEPFGTPFKQEPYGNGTQSMRTATDVISIAQVLINSDNIQPVPEIAHLARYLWQWRRLGAYVVANTSTSEGCEQGTVEYLAKHTAGGFDGILFPRNYDGKGKVTKGVALRTVVDRYVDDARPLTVIHIDDTSHHHENMPQAFANRPDTTVTGYQPLYESVEPYAGSIHDESPLKIFQRVHEHIIDEIDALNLRNVADEQSLNG